MSECLKILSGFDKKDATSASEKFPSIELKKSLRGLKVGLPKQYFLKQMEKEKKLLERWKKKCKDQQKTYILKLKQLFNEKKEQEEEFEKQIEEQAEHYERDLASQEAKYERIKRFKKVLAKNK